MTAAEGSKKEIEHSAAPPPEGIFESDGEVLVEHEGEELTVSEEALEDHLGHGDAIIALIRRAAE